MRRLVSNSDLLRCARMNVEELECRTQPAALKFAVLGQDLPHLLNHRSGPPATPPGRFVATPDDSATSAPVFSIGFTIRIQALVVSHRHADPGTPVSPVEPPGSPDTTEPPAAATPTAAPALPPNPVGGGSFSAAVAQAGTGAQSSPAAATPVNTGGFANFALILPAEGSTLAGTVLTSAVAVRELPPLPQTDTPPATRAPAETVYPWMLTQLPPEAAPEPRALDLKDDPAAPIEVAPPPRAIAPNTEQAEPALVEPPVGVQLEVAIASDATANDAPPAPVPAEGGVTTELFAVAPIAENGSHWGWLAAAAGAVAVGHWAVRTGRLKPAQEALTRWLKALKSRLLPTRVGV